MLNLYGIKESVNFNVILTVAAILGLLIIIAYLPGHFTKFDFTMPYGMFGVFHTMV